MEFHENVLGLIGNTPLVRINAITRGVTEATVLVKLETFNPGNSIKDRMAVRMIEDAERSGALRPRCCLSSSLPERDRRVARGARRPG